MLVNIIIIPDIYPSVLQVHTETFSFIILKWRNINLPRRCLEREYSNYASLSFLPYHHLRVRVSPMRGFGPRKFRHKLALSSISLFLDSLTANLLLSLLLIFSQKQVMHIYMWDNIICSGVSNLMPSKFFTLWLRLFFSFANSSTFLTKIELILLLSLKSSTVKFINSDIQQSSVQSSAQFLGFNNDLINHFVSYPISCRRLHHLLHLSAPKTFHTTLGNVRRVAMEKLYLKIIQFLIYTEKTRLFSMSLK